MHNSNSIFAPRTGVRFAAKYLSALAALFLLSQPLAAHEFKTGDITIGHPWTRATPPAAKVAGGYVKLTNSGTVPDRLVGASAEGVEAVEIHQMAVNNDVMTMREVKGGVEIKPGETVELKPASFHLMMMGLKEPFKQGQMIKGTLKFERAGTVPVEFKVEAIAAQGDGGGHADHGAAHKAQ